MCVCVLLVTWRANGIVLYMYEGKVLMDKNSLTKEYFNHCAGQTMHRGVVQNSPVCKRVDDDQLF